jgi:membrane-bound lytic murein transglycosylase A
LTVFLTNNRQKQPSSRRLDHKAATLVDHPLTFSTCSGFFMKRVLLMFATTALLIQGCSSQKTLPETATRTAAASSVNTPEPELFPPAPSEPPQPGIGEAICWSQLPGWQADQTEQALPAVIAQCELMSQRDPRWAQICAEASLQGADSTHAFFQEFFLPHRIYGKEGTRDGLFTGYYEPTLRGSLSADNTYRYPLYKRPDDLVNVELDKRFPTLKGQRVRGRIVRDSKGIKKLIAYYSRAEIDGPQKPLKGQELVWIDDADDAFFLHVQGSGRIEMNDGSLFAVGYADQNGHAYQSIGRRLVDQGYMTLEEVSMQSIRQWLLDNPKQAQALRNYNPSYVFFYQRPDANEGPRGSLNVPLTPERSAAVNRSLIPLGTPIWVDTVLPGENQPYQRLLIAQDTGGAINGPIRADIFWGRGQRAEQMAGEMKQPGQMYAFLLREPEEEKLCRR